MLLIAAGEPGRPVGTRTGIVNSYLRRPRPESCRAIAVPLPLLSLLRTAGLPPLLCKRPREDISGVHTAPSLLFVLLWFCNSAEGCETTDSGRLRGQELGDDCGGTGVMALPSPLPPSRPTIPLPFRARLPWGLRGGSTDFAATRFQLLLLLDRRLLSVVNPLLSLVRLEAIDDTAGTSPEFDLGLMGVVGSEAALIRPTACMGIVGTGPREGLPRQALPFWPPFPFGKELPSRPV